MFSKIFKQIYRLSQIPKAIAYNKIADKFINRNQSHYLSSINVIKDCNGLKSFEFYAFVQFSERICNLADEISAGTIPVFNISYNLLSKQNKINWHYDFNNSNYYGANIESSKIPIPFNSSIEIRQIWELGRLHQLIPLSVASGISKDSKEKYILAYKYHLIDFILENPVGYGVHWMSPMDVGIRAVNILYSYQFIREDLEGDTKFTNMLNNSLSEHLNFVANNPEWSSGMRGNHFFTNIVSMLILTSSAEGNSEIDEILFFAVNSLFIEIEEQFNEDGSNFEASTAYHCFVVEILLIALKTAQNLSNDKIAKLKSMLITKPSNLWHIDNNTIKLKPIIKSKLENIIKFTNILLQNNSIPRFGDDDSGAYLKFHFLPEHFLLKKLVSQYIHENQIEINTNNLNVFPQFSLINYKTTNYNIYIKTGNTGQRGKGGHSHNDCFSFILFVNGIEIISDPGTYCYTADEKLRNLYRSTELHNALYLPDSEPVEWFTGEKDDVFWMKKDFTFPEVNINKTDNENECNINLSFNTNGAKFRREIKLNDTEIECNDYYDKTVKLKSVLFHFHPDVLLSLENENLIIARKENFVINLHVYEAYISLEDYDYSDCFKSIRKAKRVKVNFDKDSVKWIIKIAENL